jgi:hypothetical protein
LYRKIKTRFFYLIAALYIVVALLSIFPWLEPVNVKVTAYTGVLALFIATYDFSIAALKIEQRKGGRYRRRVSFAFMLLMKGLLVLSPFALLRWIYFEDNKLFINNISNYVTFAAFGVVFLTRGMKLRNKSTRNLR